jgi:hypothetical protein
MMYTTDSMIYLPTFMKTGTGIQAIIKLFNDHNVGITDGWNL